MLNLIINGAWTFAVGSAASTLGCTLYDLGKLAFEVYVLNEDKEVSNEPFKESND